MKAIINGGLGEIRISEEAVAVVAGSAAVECFGVVGMASVGIKDGLVKLLKRESLRHGIEVSVDENNDITLRLHIIAAYGVNIYAVCENLIENVRYRVEDFTGLKVKSADVFVEGVKRID